MIPRTGSEGRTHPGPAASSSARACAPGGAPADPVLGLPVEAEPQQFWSNVDRQGPDECWLWNGTRTEKGYGRFKVGNSRIYAHRFVYELLVGPIPEGKQLDHRCHNDDATCPGGNSCLHRRCVNPAHLGPATTRENVLRGMGPTAQNAKRTHCPRGHTDYVVKNGKRECRICRKTIWDGETKRRKRAEAASAAAVTHSRDRASASASTTTR